MSEIGLRDTDARGFMATEESAAEVRALRARLRNLTALLALPVLWKEKHPERIAGDLLEVVTSLLRLECAYVRVSGPVGAPALDGCRPFGADPFAAVARALADFFRAFPIPFRDEHIHLTGSGHHRGIFFRNGHIHF